jgi:plasmid stabilization system protein ParE
LDYLIAQGATAAALSLRLRVEEFLADTIAVFPRSSHYIEERDVFETWIPRTNLIVWYTFTEATIDVVTFWHAAQDRRRQP